MCYHLILYMERLGTCGQELAVRGNNLGGTTEPSGLSPQHSTDVSHYGNGLMESVNLNTLNNLGLPTLEYYVHYKVWK